MTRLTTYITNKARTKAVEEGIIEIIHDVTLLALSRAKFIVIIVIIYIRMENSVRHFCPKIAQGKIQYHGHVVKELQAVPKICVKSTFMFKVHAYHLIQATTPADGRGTRQTHQTTHNSSFILH